MKVRHFLKLPCAAFEFQNQGQEPSSTDFRGHSKHPTIALGVLQCYHVIISCKDYASPRCNGVLESLGLVVVVDHPCDTVLTKPGLQCNFTGSN